MEFGEVVRRRRMVRAYDGRPVTADTVAALVDAALHAPSAGFTQGVSFLVLDQPAAVAAFWATSAEATESAWLRGMQTAPVLIGIWTRKQAYLDRYAEPDKGWTDRDPGRWSAPYWWVDAGMAVQTLLLCAVDAGLGAAFFGVPPDRVATVRAAFGVPDDQLSVGMVSLGHPPSGAPAAGSAHRRPRRPQAELVHHNSWSR